MLLQTTAPDYVEIEVGPVQLTIPVGQLERVEVEWLFPPESGAIALSVDGGVHWSEVFSTENATECLLEELGYKDFKSARWLARGRWLKLLGIYIYIYIFFYICWYRLDALFSQANLTLQI